MINLQIGKVDTYHQSGEKPVREVHTDPPPKPKPSSSGKGSGSPKEGVSLHASVPSPAHPSTFLAGFDQPTSGGGEKGGSHSFGGGGYNAWWDNGRGKGGKGEGWKGKGEKGKGKGGGGPGPHLVGELVRGGVYYPFKSWQKSSFPANSSQQSAQPSSSPTGGGNLSAPPLIV